MKLEKVLKFRESGIGNRESEIGGSFSLITYARCPIPDALDCFEFPFVYGLSKLQHFRDTRHGDGIIAVGVRHYRGVVVPFQIVQTRSEFHI